MGQIITYLTFNGNCREAMEFYQGCLGGTLCFQTIRESPKTGKLPEQLKEYIVQSSLTRDDFVLMGSDMIDEDLLRGNAISIMLNCDNEDRIKEFYQNLLAGGKATHPLKESYWGALFGGLTDKYGNRWLFQSKRAYHEKGMESTKISKVDE